MSTDTDISASAHPRYTFLEDAQGLAISAIQCGLGIYLLHVAGLITGGTAGLALLIGHLTGWSFGLTFFVVNLPFYYFAWKRRGWVFAIKSLACVTAVSAIADMLGPFFHIGDIAPPLAAILFGVVTGVGLLGLFRHGSSLGGVSIVAVIIQDVFHIRAGWVLLGYDAVLFAVALFFLAPAQIIWSLLGAVLLNLVIALNHRRDWYVVD